MGMSVELMGFGKEHIMSEQIMQIAMRIRELREIAGLSIQDLAKEFKISEELYEQYESGTVDIPVSFLYEVAQKFNVHLTAILTGEDPKLNIYSVTRKGKGIHVERRKDYKYQSLAYNFKHKKAEPFLVTVEPESPEAPFSLNSHPGQEFDYVLQGTLKIKIDNHELILHEGDSIFYDSSFPHGMKALNGQPVQFLAVIL